MRRPSGTEARAAIAAQAGAVGFVEGRFEDERADDFTNAAGHAVDVFLAFDDAGSGDEHQGLVVGNWKKSSIAPTVVL